MLASLAACQPASRQEARCQWILPNQQLHHLCIEILRGTWVSLYKTATKWFHSFMDPCLHKTPPKKAQLKSEVNQLRHDMQFNLHAAHEFARKNELHSDQKAEAILAAQHHRFEATAAK